MQISHNLAAYPIDWLPIKDVFVIISLYEVLIPSKRIPGVLCSYRWLRVGATFMSDTDTKEKDKTRGGNVRSTTELEAVGEREEEREITRDDACAEENEHSENKEDGADADFRGDKSSSVPDDAKDECEEGAEPESLFIDLAYIPNAVARLLVPQYESYVNLSDIKPNEFYMAAHFQLILTHVARRVFMKLTGPDARVELGPRSKKEIDRARRVQKLGHKPKPRPRSEIDQLYHVRLSVYKPPLAPTATDGLSDGRTPVSEKDRNRNARKVVTAADLLYVLDDRTHTGDNSPSGLSGAMPSLSEHHSSELEPNPLQLDLTVVSMSVKIRLGSFWERKSVLSTVRMSLTWVPPTVFVAAAESRLQREWNKAEIKTGQARAAAESMESEGGRGRKSRDEDSSLTASDTRTALTLTRTASPLAAAGGLTDPTDNDARTAAYDELARTDVADVDIASGAGQSNSPVLISPGFHRFTTGLTQHHRHASHGDQHGKFSGS